MDKLRGL